MADNTGIFLLAMDATLVGFSVFLLAKLLRLETTKIFIARFYFLSGIYFLYMGLISTVTVLANMYGQLADSIYWWTSDLLLGLTGGAIIWFLASIIITGIYLAICLMGKGGEPKEAFLYGFSFIFFSSITIIHVAAAVSI